LEELAILVRDFLAEGRGGSDEGNDALEASVYADEHAPLDAAEACRSSGVSICALVLVKASKLSTRGAKEQTEPSKSK
jgi:hypothetical protein